MEDIIDILNIDTTSSQYLQQKVELENFLENLNVIMKSKIELKGPLDSNDSQSMWISNKYKISNIKSLENKIF